MKLILILSLALNGVLFYRLLKVKETTKTKVKIVRLDEEGRRTTDSSASLKSHRIVDTRSVNPAHHDRVNTSDAKSVEVSEINSAPRAIDVPPLTEQEYQELQEKIANDRREYLESIGVTESALRKSDQLMQRYSQKNAEIYKNMKDHWNLDDRKRLLRLEEQYHQDLEKVFGPEKYKKYEEFKTTYNNRILNCEEGDCAGAFVLMGP